MRKWAFGSLTGQCRYFVNVEFQVNCVFCWLCFVFDFGLLFVNDSTTLVCTFFLNPPSGGFDHILNCKDFFLIWGQKHDSYMLNLLYKAETFAFLPQICIPSLVLFSFSPMCRCECVCACWLPIYKLLSSLPTQVVLQKYTVVISSSVYLNMELLKCLCSVASLNGDQRNISQSLFNIAYQHEYVWAFLCIHCFSNLVLIILKIFMKLNIQINLLSFVLYIYSSLHC